VLSLSGIRLRLMVGVLASMTASTVYVRSLHSLEREPVGSLGRNAECGSTRTVMSQLGRDIGDDDRNPELRLGVIPRSSLGTFLPSHDGRFDAIYG
jgi:hypothetical protein